MRHHIPDDRGGLMSSTVVGSRDIIAEGGSSMPRSPENREAPNKSELKPTTTTPPPAKALGAAAIKGANQGSKKA